MERFGRYVLVRKLGAGGMAEVFLAREPLAQGVQKQVVIKRVLPAYARSPHFVTMFVDEAKIAADLNHPNVVQVFDFGHVDQSYYLAMEYVEGIDLAILLKRTVALGRRIPYGLAAYVVQQMTKGLDYAHRRRDERGEPLGIVHRDVSPQNVLVSFDGAVKLVDFGIARARGSHDEEGVVRGKFAYMSPEQARGAPVDRRSDVFSAGVVLFELALGRARYGERHGPELIAAVRDASPPAPRDLDPALPDELDAILRRALAPRPDERFQTARDLQSALGQFFHGLARGGAFYDSATLAAFVAQLSLRGAGDPPQAARAAPAVAARRAEGVPRAAPAARVRVGPGAERGPSPLLVGRGHELRILEDALEAVATRGAARLVVLLGEPGVGRRAVIDAAVAARGATSARVVRALLRPGDADVPFGLAARLLRTLVDAPPGADAAALRPRVTAALPGAADALVRLLAPAPPGAPRAGQADREEPHEPHERRAVMLRALRRLLERQGRRSPLLVVVEGLERSDAHSLDLLATLLGERSPQPLLALATARPDARLERLLRSPATIALQLGPLPLEACEALAAARFVEPAEGRRLGRALHATTGGHPLFLLEALESLADRGLLGRDGGRLTAPRAGGALELPATLDAALAARLTALPSDDAWLLGAAAVLGPELSVAELVALVGHPVGDGLGRLAGRGLLRSGPDEGWRFSHERVQRAARGALPEAERRALHHRAATLLVESAAFQPGPDDVRAARHLERAGHAAEAGRLTLRAAESARDCSGAAEAYRLYGAALRLLPPDEPGRFEAHLEREQLLRGWGRRKEQLRDLRAMLRLAEATGDPARASCAHARLARLYLDLGRAARAGHALARALEAARAAGDRAQEAEALRLEAVLLATVGRNAEAEEQARRALALCGEDRAGLLARGAILNTLGIALTHVGKLREAVAAYAEALVIYRRLAARRMEATTLNNLAIVSVGLGELEEALATYQRSLRIDQETGDRFALGIKLANMGQLYLDLGDPDRALRYLGKALGLHEETGDRAGAADAVISLGQVHLRRAEPALARPVLERGLALATEARSAYQEIRALVYLAFARLEQGEAPDGALALARQAVRRARETTIPQGEAYGLMAEAMALGAAGRLGEAVARSAEAAALVGSGDRAGPAAGRPELEGIEELLHVHARVLCSAGQRAAARAPLERAVAEVRAKARRLRDPRWRRRYLASPPAREILADWEALFGTGAG